MKYMLSQLKSKKIIIYLINDNFNCIIINSENLGISAYIGQGAGKLATAHAIVLDIIEFCINN